MPIDPLVAKRYVRLISKKQLFPGNFVASRILDGFMDQKGKAIVAFLEQCITESRNGYYDNQISSSKKSIDHPSTSNLMNSENFPKIFISHSSKDEKIAGMLADLIKNALRLSVKEIRCTSVDGYKLPGGASVDTQLRDEILRAKVVIGLISSISFSSAYVLFELGARWGAKSALIPLLVPGTTPDDLKGPIKGYSPLRIDNSSQLHQMISQISSLISVTPENPEAYQRMIENIVKSFE